MPNVRPSCQRASPARLACQRRNDLVLRHAPLGKTHAGERRSPGQDPSAPGRSWALPPAASVHPVGGRVRRRAVGDVRHRHVLASDARRPATERADVVIGSGHRDHVDAGAARDRDDGVRGRRFVAVDPLVVRLRRLELRGVSGVPVVPAASITVVERGVTRRLRRDANDVGEARRDAGRGGPRREDRRRLLRLCPPCGTIEYTPAATITTATHADRDRSSALNARSPAAARAR